MTAFNNLDDSTRDGLQNLLRVSIDSYKGWEAAAEQTKDPSLQTFFRQMSDVRRHNAAELRQLVAAAGEKPAESGSISGQLHRWWIDAKQALTRGDTKSILNEAERGEDSIRDTYQKQLPEIRDQRAYEVVERQFQGISASHDRVKAMRDSVRNP
jgi:uncharacterized protein (TIGR02284 family)